MSTTVKRDGDYLVTTYDAGTTERRYWPEGTVRVVPARRITELQIRRLLTAEERAGIRAAVKADDQVADWMEMIQAAARSGAPLAGDDPDLRAGFLRLHELGVFTLARLREVEAQVGV